MKDNLEESIYNYIIPDEPEKEKEEFIISEDELIEDLELHIKEKKLGTIKKSSMDILIDTFNSKSSEKENPTCFGTFELASTICYSCKDKDLCMQLSIMQEKKAIEKSKKKSKLYASIDNKLKKNIVSPIDNLWEELNEDTNYGSYTSLSCKYCKECKVFDKDKLWNHLTWLKSKKLIDLGNFTFEDIKPNVPSERFILDNTDHKCKILIVGEDPGANCMVSQTSLTPDTKKWIYQFIKEYFKEEDHSEIVFTNAIRCFSDYKYKPLMKEINLCKNHLLQEIKIRDPQYILLMGNIACKSILGKEGITNLAGKHECWIIEGKERIVFPIYNYQHVMKAPDKLIDFDYYLRKFSNIVYNGLPKIPKLTIHNITNYNSLMMLLSKIQHCNTYFSLDIETNHLLWWKDDFKILSISFSFEKNIGYTMLLNHKDNNYVGKEMIDNFILGLRFALKETKAIIIGSNILQFDIPAIFNTNQRKDLEEKLINVHDTVPIHWMVWEDSLHGLDFLMSRYTDMPNYKEEFEKLVKSNKELYHPKHGGSYENFPVDTLLEYNGKDAIGNYKLYEELMKLIDKDYTPEAFKELYNGVFVPVSYMLSDMKCRGMRIDYKALQKMQEMINILLSESIYQIRSYPEILKYEKDMKLKDPKKYKEFIFNPESPKQIREVLTEEPYFNLIDKNNISIDILNRADSGEISTDEENLIVFSAYNDIAKLFLKRRNIETINKLYINKLLNGKNTLQKYFEDGEYKFYVHSSFGMTNTVTGRLSASDPNVQQLQREPFLLDKVENFNVDSSEELKFYIEIDHIFYYSKLGKVHKSLWIKNIFIPRSENYEFVEIDVKQTEARLFAEFCGDQELIKMFKESDPYKIMASEIFKCNIKDVTKEQRQNAKTTFLSIIYDRHAKSIAKQYGWTVEKAKEMLDKMFKRYPNIKKYHNSQKYKIKKDMRVVSLFGRIRRLYNVLSYDYNVANEAFRQGLNQPIQATGSDLILMESLVIEQTIKIEKLLARILALVHDSILSECLTKSIDYYIKTKKEIMEELPKEFGINIPMGVDIKRGKRLGIMEEVKI